MSEATSRTSAATEARMRARDERYAARLRDRGWLVLEPATPEEIERLRALDPCADGCSDPAAHAEGGHDV